MNDLGRGCHIIPETFPSFFSLLIAKPNRIWDDMLALTLAHSILSPREAMTGGGQPVMIHDQASAYPKLVEISGVTYYLQYLGREPLEVLWRGAGGGNANLSGPQRHRQRPGAATNKAPA
jgi:hypothetical protein